MKQGKMEYSLNTIGLPELQHFNIDSIHLLSLFFSPFKLMVPALVFPTLFTRVGPTRKGFSPGLTNKMPPIL